MECNPQQILLRCSNQEEQDGLGKCGGWERRRLTKRHQMKVSGLEGIIKLNWKLKA